MKEILQSLNFQQIYFKGKVFDQITIEDAIDHLAKYFQKNVYSQSPFILFTAFNHIKTIITYYAILKAGKIAVILDPQTKSIELEEIIEDVDPCAVVSLDEKIISFDYSHEIVFRKQDKHFVINSNLKDVCTIAYTNAEDGFSKGAMLTEKNLLSEVYPMIKTNGLTEDTVTCALLPFSHLYGLVQGILVPTHAGASALINELNVLRLNEIINEIEEYKVSHLYTIPSVYYLFCKVPDIERIFLRIKEFYSGGIQLPQFILESFYQKTKHKIREGYGLTESAACAAYNYQESGPVTNSFGRAFPGCEIKIMDDCGEECPTGKIGEICLKGDIVFKGYFNHESATKTVLKNDWLYTGDYGRKDREGYFYFCGLKKKMINMAGNNVYPRKLERLIGANNNVLSVSVYSEESVLQGHTVGAIVKLKDASKKAQEELRLWCAKNINNTILPKSYLFE
ncbi:MAG TPA: class I adenylate-forming enzyme family protein [Bacteroidales bacterium]